jgi:hypothetical protein
VERAPQDRVGNLAASATTRDRPVICSVRPTRDRPDMPAQCYTRPLALPVPPRVRECAVFAAAHVRSALRLSPPRAGSAASFGVIEGGCRCSGRSIPPRRCARLWRKAHDLLVSTRVAELGDKVFKPGAGVAIAAKNTIPPAVAVVSCFRFSGASRGSDAILLPRPLMRVASEPERQPLPDQAHHLRRPKEVVRCDGDALGLANNGEILERLLDFRCQFSWPNEAHVGEQPPLGRTAAS